jgi:hypothetical protein
VAARSNACTVFARSNAGIVSSNPAQGIDVCIACVYSVFVLSCVDRGLATANPPVQGVLPTVYAIKKLKKQPKSNKGLYSHENNNNNNNNNNIYYESWLKPQTLILSHLSPISIFSDFNITHPWMFRLLKLGFELHRGVSDTNTWNSLELTWKWICCCHIPPWNLTCYLPTNHSALQPWVSLGLIYNQSPLFSIPHLLFPSFHLHLLQVTLNIV